MDETTKPTRGGKRAGSGRKAFLKDANNWKAYLDKNTHDFFVTLGAGNFSAGIRKAREIIEGSTHAEPKRSTKAKSG